MLIAFLICGVALAIAGSIVAAAINCPTLPGDDPDRAYDPWPKDVDVDDEDDSAWSSLEEDSGEETNCHPKGGGPC